MPNSSPQLSYTVAPEVRWVVEKRGLLLLKGNEKYLEVAYPQAAAWDLISRGYRMPALVSALSSIAGLDEHATKVLLFETLSAWLATGFLVQQDNDG